MDQVGAEPAVADRERADRVAVVRPADARKVVGSVAPVVPVLQGDLQGLFHCRRAVGGEEEVGVVDRHDRGQRLRQLDDDPVAVAEHRGVRARPSWARRASSSSGTWCPSVLTQSDEIASR